MPHALVLLAATLGLGSTGHLGGAGHTPNLIGVGLALALTLPIALRLSTRRVTRGRVAAFVTWGQLCVHAALQLTSGATAGACHGSGSGHHAVHLTCTPSTLDVGQHTSVGALSLRMLVAHTVAAATIAVLVTRVDALLTSLLGWILPQPLRVHSLVEARLAGIRYAVSWRVTSVCWSAGQRAPPCAS